MKKYILYGLLALIIGGVITGGIIYNSKKEEIAELEKMGVEFLNQTLEEEEGVPEASSKEATSEEQDEETQTGETGKNSEVKPDTSPKNEAIPNSKPQDEANKEKPVEEVPQGVSTEDKLTAVSIIVSKVPASQLNRLKQMAAGGVTAEEKREAKAILKSYLSSSDIETLRSLANKYQR